MAYGNGSGEAQLPGLGDYYITTDQFPTTSGLYSTLRFAQTDSHCADTPDTAANAANWALSGVLKVSKLQTESNGHLELSLDVLVGSQRDHLKGSVSARYCDVAVRPLAPCE